MIKMGFIEKKIQDSVEGAIRKELKPFMQQQNERFEHKFKQFCEQVELMIHNDVVKEVNDRLYQYYMEEEYPNYDT